MPRIVFLPHHEICPEGAVVEAEKGESICAAALRNGLDIAHACYMPEVVEHIPGVSNVTADGFSRKVDPNHQFSVPAILQHLSPDELCDRDANWWRSSDPTPATAIKADRRCC